MTSSPAAPAAAPSRPRLARLADRVVDPDPMLRRLAGITLVNTMGNGLMLAVSVLFFTRVLGLSAAQLGLALTVAGLCGVAASVPAGRAADRWGARPVLVALVSLEAVGTAGYALVDGYLAFVLLAAAVTAVDRGSAAVRNALFAEVLAPERRVAGRAYLRVVTNVGMCLGTGLGAIVLQIDSRPGYLTGILLNAVSFAVAAVLYARLPGAPRAPRTERGAEAGTAARAGRTGREPNPALRDGPFLVVTVLNAVLCLQFPVLEIGVPLWIVQHTDAPRITVAATLVLNTVMVIGLQVWAARGTEDPARAARICGRAGLLLGASCLVLALAHGLSPLVAAAVVLGGVALQALGEVLSQAAGWALSYDLAGERAHGAYQGVFNAGVSASMMAGPAVVTVAVIAHGLIGWAALGAVLAGAGLAMGPTVRWARGRADAAAVAG